MNPLRDLAHSYADELPEPRPAVEPTRVTRRDVVEILVGIPIAFVLIIGIPFLLFVMAGGGS